MTGMPLRLAASLRIVFGLLCMTVILLFYGNLRGSALWPSAAQANVGTAIVALVLLASISGGIPLLIYFAGLRLTRASTAGYFEMMQTLAAVCITWGFFHAVLHPHQIVAGIVLMAAVFMVQKAQAAVRLIGIYGTLSASALPGQYPAVIEPGIDIRGNWQRSLASPMRLYLSNVGGIYRFVSVTD
jgi:uncharacterized membrane protein